MKIIRYSITGFKPQYQSHHLGDIDYHRNHFNISVFPEWTQRNIQEIHERKLKFYNENYTDFEYGVWAFINGYKNNMALNHLKQRVPCWEAEISDNTIVYDVNWECKMPITDPLCTAFGFYIPVCQLNTLKNVQRRIKIA